VDVVGSTSLLVEAEVASAAVECVQKLGFTEFKLRLNHRGLLRAVVERAGIAAEQEVDAITAIDKLDKVGQEGVDRELSERGVSEAGRSSLLELLSGGATLERVAQFLSGHAAGEQAIADLRRMLELSQDTAAAGRLSFDLALARGLGYYTGCIFELASPKFGGSIGGGGRYDNLIGLFLGKQVPACGLALGFERLLLLMEEGGLFPPDLAALDVLLASTSEDGAAELLLAARELRALGLRVSLLPKPEKPGKLRKTAEEQQARHAIWLESGRFQVWTRAGDVSARDLDRSALVQRLRAEA
jgi:histidyl-tRNA synthetase